MKAPLELQTERLWLRQFRPADHEAHAAMLADPEVVRYLGDGRPLDGPAAFRAMAVVLGHWQLRGFGFWAVEERASGALLGRGGLWYPEGWPMLEVGWTLARAHWGKGYAHELGEAALRVAFEQGAPEVCSLILPGNARSIRVAERLGQVLRGPSRVGAFDCLLYSVRRPGAPG